MGLCLRSVTDRALQGRHIKVRIPQQPVLSVVGTQTQVLRGKSPISGMFSIIFNPTFLNIPSIPINSRVKIIKRAATAFSMQLSGFANKGSDFAVSRVITSSIYASVCVEYACM